SHEMFAIISSYKTTRPLGMTGCDSMRSCGVLLHISSLPGTGGIGSLGQEARNFVDFLAKSGQSWWQVLPLTPPAQGNSPYSSYSVFAGNPAFISLETLEQDGILP